jgi:hypothetical protein
VTADRYAEDVGLDLRAQVVGGDTAVDLEHVEVDSGVLPVSGPVPRRC